MPQYPASTNRSGWLNGIRLALQGVQQALESVPAGTFSSGAGHMPQNVQKQGVPKRREDLLRGDPPIATQRMADSLEFARLRAELDEPAKAKDQFPSIRTSVRSRMSIRVGGYAGNDRRHLFYAWAKEFLSTEELERVLSIGRAYIDTSVGPGLMKPPEKPDERQLSEAMMRFRMKPGGG